MSKERVVEIVITMYGLYCNMNYWSSRRVYFATPKQLATELLSLDNDVDSGGPPNSQGQCYL